MTIQYQVSASGPSAPLVRSFFALNPEVYLEDGNLAL